jgi:hypothetical protein
MEKAKGRKPSKDVRSSVAIFTDIADSKEAGKYIGSMIHEAFEGDTADVVIVFCSSKYKYDLLLKAIKVSAQPKTIVGCSSAGEFISNKQGEDSISAVAIRSDDMRFSVGIGKDISGNAEKAADQVVSSFKGMDNQSYPYHSALILADALAGHTDTIIDRMNQLTAGTYQFFGGGAGDDAKFDKTHVFIGDDAFTDAVVALEILSKKPLGIGVRHGWEEASQPMRVTESDGRTLISINATPAAELFKDFANSTGQEFDQANPTSFFLHNVIGIKTTNGFKLRVPLSINKDKSIICAADIPTGVTITIMKTTSKSAAEAAIDATQDAVKQMHGQESGIALVFDCVATRLRTGKEFSLELQAIEDILGQTKLVGCNTYGQISRVDGQFSGFHNCTAVVCILPQ